MQQLLNVAFVGEDLATDALGADTLVNGKIMLSHDFVPSTPLSSTEGPKIGNVGFRPATSHSAQLSTAMRVALSVFASGQFSAEKPGWGRPNRTVRTSPLESRNFSIFQISSNDIPFDAPSDGDAHGAPRSFLLGGIHFCFVIVLHLLRNDRALRAF
eukprot:COSAG01_NODE_4202_length_5244_cov_168.024101_8_plen_157_part_00